MTPDHLDRLLADYARQPPPLSVGPSHAEVWHAIEQRSTQSVWTRMVSLLEWRELFGEPRMALVAATFAVVVGVVPAVIVGRAMDQSRIARESFHFDVFTVNTASIGSIFAKPIAVASSSQR